VNPPVPVVILCGGRGTRLREGKREIPKALVPIGGVPILLHIMRLYASRGFSDFVLCLGYRGGQIRRFWARPPREARGWRVDCVDTGVDTNTAGRLKRAAPHIRSADFFATYGDGLSDIDPRGLLAYHLRHGRAATMTCVKPPIQFGVAELGPGRRVTAYVEKPPSEKWVNGGFFVFQRRMLSYIRGDEVLEQGPFARLTRARELVAYPFRGFWNCMDTYKDNLRLNELWDGGQAPWRV